MRVPSVARSAGPWSARSSKTRPNCVVIELGGVDRVAPEERQGSGLRPGFHLIEGIALGQHVDDQHEEDDTGRNSRPIPVPRQTVIHTASQLTRSASQRMTRLRPVTGKIFGSCSNTVPVPLGDFSIAQYFDKNSPDPLRHILTI